LDLGRDEEFEVRDGADDEEQEFKLIGEMQDTSKSQIFYAWMILFKQTWYTG
jgi:hypothetical protein